MPFRKLFTRITLGLILVLAVSACGNATKGGREGQAAEGNTASANEKIEISFMGWGNEQEREIYAAVFKKFEAKYSQYKVNYIYVPKDYDTKLKTMITGNTVPDVFYVENNKAAEFVKTGKLAVLDLFFEVNEDLSKLKTNFVKGLLEYGTIDEKIYAIPKGWEPYLLYVNKDLFKKAGVPVPTGDWTMDEFMDIAKKLTIQEGKQTSQYGVALDTWWGPWMVFAGNEGGAFFKDGKSNFSDPNVIKGIQRMYDMFQTDKTAPSPSSVQQSGMGQSQMFETGKVAMYPAGGWMIPTYRKSVGFDWTAVEMPMSATRLNPVFAAMLAMSEDSKHKEAAAKLMAFVLSKDGWQDTVSMGLEMPADTSLYNDPQLLTEPPVLAPRKAAGEYLDSTIQLNLARTGKFSEYIDKIVQPELDNAFNGKKTIAEAAKKIDEAANRDLFK